MTNPIKAYVIDPFTWTVTEVQRPSGGRSNGGSLREIYDLIACDCVTAVYPENSGSDALYVDDNGLDRADQAYFFCTLYPHQPLAGKGLWVGSTPSGNDTSPEMSIEYVRAHIQWLLTR